MRLKGSPLCGEVLQSALVLTVGSQPQAATDLEVVVVDRRLTVAAEHPATKAAHGKKVRVVELVIADAHLDRKDSTAGGTGRGEAAQGCGHGERAHVVDAIRHEVRLVHALH